MTVFHQRIAWAFALLAASPGWAISSGAPEGSTGAPGDDTCTACHGGTANSGSGRIRIDAGGSTYTPGQKMVLKVILEDSAAMRWGFQLTARSQADPQATAGALATTDANTQIVKAGTKEWITHTLAGTRRGTAGPVTFEFEWTPPADGGVVLYAAGNAANNNNNSTGDLIYTANTTLTAAGGSGGVRPAFTADAVRDIWTGRAGLAPGAWVTITGTDLATAEAHGSPVSGSPLPTTLGGATVKVNDVAAPISFASPTKVTFLAPAATPEGDVAVVVERGGQAGDRVTVRAASALPAIHSVAGEGDRLYAAVTTAGSGALFSLLSNKGWILGKPESDPRAARGAYPGEDIDIYATGLGRTEPEFVTDRLLSGALNTTAMPVVRFGGTSVTPSMAAMVSPGIYLVRVKVPESQAPGDVALTIEQGGVTSAANVFLFVQAR